MGKEPKLQLYSDAECLSDRPECARIAGRRVANIERSQDRNGDWNYTVYEPSNKTSEPLRCLEAELIPVPPSPLVPDSERMLGIIHNTAILRYSVRSDGLRKLLLERGLDPQRCLQLSCDQGYDVNITLVLPDCTVINADYREHKETHQAIGFSEWNVENYSDREIDLCREILSQQDTSEFDTRVRRCFEEHSAATDRNRTPG
jgi:hypothetical protein